MKITNVTVGYSRLVTDGNYSNRRFSCELTVELRDGDHWECERDNLQKKCIEYVESKLKDDQVYVVSKDEHDKIKSLVTSVKNLGAFDLPF